MVLLSLYQLAPGVGAGGGVPLFAAASGLPCVAGFLGLKINGRIHCVIGPKGKRQTLFEICGLGPQFIVTCPLILSCLLIRYVLVLEKQYYFPWGLLLECGC